jgi:hypothetical protein
MGWQGSAEPRHAGCKHLIPKHYQNLIHNAQQSKIASIFTQSRADLTAIATKNAPGKPEAS